MSIKKVKYILIANGNKALIYKSLGNLHYIELVRKFTSDSPRLTSHEIGTDKPGRGKEGIDLTLKHTADSKTDLHKKEKQSFLTEVTNYLNTSAEKSFFTDLIIIASPEALGSIRNKLDKNTKSMVLAEIDKDLTHIAAEDIPEFVERYMEDA